MKQYLVAIYHPDDYDPSTEDEAMSRDIDALNDEMKAARVRIFVGGLSPARSASSLRAQPAGKVLVTDGPYGETKEHIAGFFGCWKPLTWMRHWRGGARLPSPVGRRSRYASLTDGGPNGSKETMFVCRTGESHKRTEWQEKSMPVHIRRLFSET